MTVRKDKPGKIPGGPLSRRGGSPLPPMQEKMLKTNPEFRRWVKRITRDLYDHYLAKGEGRIIEPERQLIDKLLSELVARRTIELYLNQGGLLRKDRADQGVLEAHPLMQTWQSLGNSINRTLLALEQIKGSGPTQGPALAEILATYTVEDDKGGVDDPGVLEDEKDEGVIP